MTIREKIKAREHKPLAEETDRGMDKIDRALIRAGAIIIAGQIIGAIIGGILARK